MINRGLTQSPTTHTRGAAVLRASTIVRRGVIPRASTTVSAGISPRAAVAGWPRGASAGGVARRPAGAAAAARLHGHPVGADLHDLGAGADLHPGFGQQFQEHAPVDEVEVEGGLGQHLHHHHLLALPGEMESGLAPDAPASGHHHALAGLDCRRCRRRPPRWRRPHPDRGCRARRFGAHRDDQPVGALRSHRRGIGRDPSASRRRPEPSPSCAGSRGSASSRP